MRKLLFGEPRSKPAARLQWESSCWLDIIAVLRTAKGRNHTALCGADLRNTCHGKAEGIRVLCALDCHSQ